MVRIEALRSDGATASRIEHVKGAAVEVARTLRFPSGEIVAIDDLRGQFTRSASPGRPRKIRDPGHDCIRTAAGEELFPGARVTGREIVGGYTAVVVKRGSTTTWYAPKLSCALLGQDVDRGSSRSEQRLRSVTLGEPAAELFSTDGLREVSAQDLMKKNRQ